MKRSQYYDLRLPERGARPGEANDSADIEDLSFDMVAIDAQLEVQRKQAQRLEDEKATKLALAQHASLALLAHPDASVTDEKLGERSIGGMSGLLQALLTALGNAVRAIVGLDAQQAWNTPPATTLAQARAHQEEAMRHVAQADREQWDTVTQRLALEGGTLTNFLTLHAMPTQNKHAATKEYVDVKLAVSGNGDMTKAEYATLVYGVVKNAQQAQTADTAQSAAHAQHAEAAESATTAHSIDGGNY